MTHVGRPRKKRHVILRWAIYILIGILVVLFIASHRTIPDTFTYGVSFSRLHSEELKLDWKKTYLAILDDLGVKHLRLAAHWDATEIEQGKYDWSTLDFQIEEARKRDADIILAVGRRVPGWPECHEPTWFKGLSAQDKETELLTYVKSVVNRYKGSSAIKYWQIENEAFLTMYAREHCDTFFSEEILKKEIALVRELDPSRKIIITDSGEIGLWYKAYRNADIFGTSLYVYVWNHTLGPMRYPMLPGFFSLKYNLVRLFNGTKPAFISELSAEPWLLKPIIDTSIEDQLKQMNIERFNTVIEFAQKTGFETQYLWGAEWWYYLKQNNHPDMWERAKEIYSESK